jgi:hypothetical protein
MKKFTLFLASLFMTIGAVAQVYSATETKLTSAELNAKTEPTYIAIKNLSRTNNYYYVGNTGAAPYSKATFTNDAVFIWEPVAGEEGKFYLKKLDGKYMQSSSPKDFGAIGTAAKFATTNPTSKGSGATKFNGDGDSQAYINGNDDANLVRFVTNGKWINVQNGNSGTPTYNNGEGGWTIHYVYAVEEVFEFVTVTYNFVYNSDVKYSKTYSVAKGASYPEVEVPSLPYGVTVSATKPEGNVTDDVTCNFDLSITRELPFVTATSAENINTWYYARMHTNQPGYIGDFADDNSINVGQGKSSAEYNENFIWGFVGNVFDGVTVVNKGTGLQLTSTGSGQATLTNNGTPFFVAHTAETSANAKNGFCLRKKDSNQYLNANHTAGKLSHWGSADAGSTMFLTQYNETSVTVSDADFATLYLGQSTYVPVGVEIYTVTETTNGYVKTELVEGTILPANTGVILKNAGQYTFKAAAKDGVAALEGNLLLGSTTNTYVEGAAYVLGKDTEGVGFFKTTLNKNAEGGEGDTHFLNNANKAYLPATAVPAGVKALRFNIGGTTAIESVLNNGVNANAPIYDLSGRRVMNALKGGIYIQNGKKFIVK